MAKVIKQRSELKTERDLFVTQINGWDTHTNNYDRVKPCEP